jgi:CMP-N-acetylneuraminic acid synthetase
MKGTKLIVALIPARGGSERVPQKNVRHLQDRPLLGYTIRAAKHSGVFDHVFVSTEDIDTKFIAREYGAEVINRPAAFARADSPDIEWVNHAVRQLWDVSPTGFSVSPPGAFMILRPSNPFRTSATIERAWETYQAINPARDLKNMEYEGSMRSVERGRQHPGKMWKVVLHKHARTIIPVWEGGHDLPTQSLSEVYVQNGCIHIATPYLVVRYGNYTGARTHPFFTEGYEGLDINTEEDWILAEALIERGLVELEEI